MLPSETLKLAFDFFAGKRGWIGASQLIDLLVARSEQVEEEVIHELIREVDVQGTGKIHFADFKQMMKKFTLPSG